MRKHRLRRNFPSISGQRKDHKGQTTYINISIRVLFDGSRSLLSFVSSQVCTPSCFLFQFLPLLARARSWLVTTCHAAWDSVLLIQRLFSKVSRELRPGKNLLNSGHPNKMYRFPSSSHSWRWVGRSGKKKQEWHEGFLVPVKAGLLSTKLGNVVLSFVIRWYKRNRTAKCLKRQVSMII